MNEKYYLKKGLFVTAILTIAVWSLLAWDHYHGGVPSHHLLARKDLPAISNWWGGALLPMLIGWLLYRIQKRCPRVRTENQPPAKIPATILYGLSGGLLVGILLAVFFTFGYADIPGYLLMIVLLLALFLPVYRAECLLGFLTGMTFTFGTVLPTLIGSLLVMIAAVLYLLVRPLILFLATGIARIASSNKNDQQG